MVRSLKGKTALYSVLDDYNNVVRTDDVTVWAKFFQSDRRFIATSECGDLTVSTVFVGLASPVISQGREFETCIIEHRNSGKNEYNVVATYGSYDEAMKGHKFFVKKYLAAKPQLPEPEFGLEEIEKAHALVRKA